MNGEKRGMDHIVRRTGLSRATISRALNNCGSVSSEVKEAVVRAAEEIGYVPPQKQRVKKPDGGYLVAAVLPENPSFFWGEAARGLMEAASGWPEARLVYSLFSRLNSEKDALYCIDYLLDLKPDVLIAAVPVFESVKKKLNAAPVPVVCFSESGDVRPAFYVGADFYMDGVTLARAAAKRLNARARAVKIENERMPMTTLRDEGFRRELMNLLPLLEWTGTVDTSGWNHAETPALLARALKDMEFDTLYVSQGQLPQVMTALGKLKRRDFVQVVGYERPGGRYEGDARLAAVMEQDIRGQGAMCMEAVRQYLTQGIVPDGGRLLIGSRLTAGGEVRK